MAATGGGARDRRHTGRETSHVFFLLFTVALLIVGVCVRFAEGVYICRYFGSRAVDGRGPTDRPVTLRRDNECK